MSLVEARKGVGLRTLLFLLLIILLISLLFPPALIASLPLSLASHSPGIPGVLLLLPLTFLGFVDIYRIVVFALLLLISALILYSYRDGRSSLK